MKIMIAVVIGMKHYQCNNISGGHSEDISTRDLVCAAGNSVDCLFGFDHGVESISS